MNTSTVESITIALWIHAWLNLGSIVIPLWIPYDPITPPERKSIMNPLWTYEFSMNSVWIHYESNVNPLYDSLPNPLWTHFESRRFPYESIVNHTNSRLNSVWVHYESIYDSGMDSSWLHHGLVWPESGIIFSLDEFIELDLAGRIYPARSRWTNSSS